MAENHSPVFTDRLRLATKRYADWVGKTLADIGVSPDALTVLGTLLVAISGFFIARGEFGIAFIFVLLGLPMDFLDGAVARATKGRGRFGEVFDSTMDRYADGFLFIGFSYYFAANDQLDMSVVSLLAMLGTLIVSYTRARADGVDVATKVGLFTRLERVIIVGVILLIPSLITLGIWVLAIGTNFTVLQRLWFVYKTLQEREVQ